MNMDQQDPSPLLWTLHGTPLAPRRHSELCKWMAFGRAPPLTGVFCFMHNLIWGTQLEMIEAQVIPKWNHTKRSPQIPSNSLPFQENASKDCYGSQEGGEEKYVFT